MAGNTSIGVLETRRADFDGGVNEGSTYRFLKSKISGDTIWNRQISHDVDSPHRRLAAMIIIQAWKDLRRKDSRDGAAHFLCETLWVTALAGMFPTVTQEKMREIVAGVLDGGANGNGK